MRVVGVDRANGAWVAVVLDDRAFAGAFRFDSLESAMSVGGAVVGVDIPIGLPAETIGRRCDAEARAALGPRGSTVFPALPRRLYEAPYDEATRNDARIRFGRAYSRQAWSLGPAVLEASAVAERHGEVVEVHPELVFAELAGAPLPSKRTRDGVRARVGALASAGVEVPLPGRPAGTLPSHDVLDAAACAVGALRVADGVAVVFPSDARPWEPVIRA